MPPRTSNAEGGTPRRVTLVRWPSILLRSDMTMTDSAEARAWPSGPRRSRASARITLRSSGVTSENISEAEPRLTMIALPARPLPRRAARNPSAMAMSTVNTATTSVMPTTARSVSRQRTRMLRRL
jgi:hypothetical protein